MKVCVLGCGPAGLLSAFACELMTSAKVTIISSKEKSKIPGAVFLHEPIPWFTAPIPEGEVRFIKHGTKEGYAHKVYGDPMAECSWDLFPEGLRPAWSMMSLYDRLWNNYERIIQERFVDHKLAARLVGEFDLVLSTIPAFWLCHNSNHQFRHQDIYVLDKAVDKSENTIIYNGDYNDNWYRTSNIFGFESTESTIPIPTVQRRLGAEASTGFKPVRTDCDCLPQVHRVGRFGQWKKGILVHHAFKQTVKLLEDI